MKKGTRRKRPTVTQEPSVFSGVLKCPECGGNLNFHFNQGNHDIKFFSCQNHNSGLRKCSKTHYIRLEFLERVVLYEVNRLAHFANEYEDNISGKLTDERFSKMCLTYEQEQKELVASTDELEKEMELYGAKEVNVKSFLKMVRSYIEPEQLTPEVLRMFVEKIVLHEGDRSSGQRIQQVDIYYNFVGQINMSMETVKTWKKLGTMSTIQSRGA